MHPNYEITVRPHWRNPDRFALFNEQSGAFAGDRLFRGSSDDGKNRKWPFKTGAEWVTHDTLAAAEAAAKKLQDYLEAREKVKDKKK